MKGSLFDEIGGIEAIVVAVDVFYNKVFDDPTLAPFFIHLSMDNQRKKMVSFMAWAFGGPDEYKGKNLRSAHMQLVKNHGLNEAHFDAVVSHLVDTLLELQVSQELIDCAVEIVVSTKDQVLNR